MFLPEDVLYILQTLTDVGFEAYIVGGCVRDSLLGVPPKDWDITTSAKPDETKNLFARTFDTGIQHGTVTVVLNHTNYEVTTYRVDGEYDDCRRPNSVAFTKNLEDDLLRRDFTMNAIAYHPQMGYQDPFGGMQDIAAKTIRGVGDPSLRFQEDALRMLRCVRFAAQLGFTVEESTSRALCDNRALIQKISAERIREELGKLWLCKFQSQTPLLWNSGLLAEIDPLLSERLTKKADAVMQQLPAAKGDAVLSWSIVMQDYTPDEAAAFLRRLKFSNADYKRIRLLVDYIKRPLPADAYPLRQLAGKLGVDVLFQLLTLHNILQPSAAVCATTACFQQILDQGDCLTLKDLAVDGGMLIAAGVPQGKLLGEVLSQLLDFVHQFPKKNRREVLLEKAVALLDEK